MKAADLDRVIQIQRRAAGLDLYGTPVETWALVATMRAQLLQHATDDKEGARGHTTDAVRIFRTRWLDGVSLENRVTYDGQQYQITQIKELGRRRGLDLTVEKVGL
ncbi:phage head closure protein [Bradyrhizobium sp. DASA03120]|uniref:phage head closure protein n=1 Tax=Bradyrhizobium sp. SMVTL-02 TaxID=3395917 RepID=UPI003F72B968